MAFFVANLPRTSHNYILEWTKVTYMGLMYKMILRKYLCQKSMTIRYKI